MSHFAQAGQRPAPGGCDASVALASWLGAELSTRQKGRAFVAPIIRERGSGDGPHGCWLGMVFMEVWTWMGRLFMEFDGNFMGLFMEFDGNFMGLEWHVLEFIGTFSGISPSTIGIRWPSTTDIRDMTNKHSEDKHQLWMFDGSWSFLKVDFLLFLLQCRTWYDGFFQICKVQRVVTFVTEPSRRCDNEG